MRSPQNHGFAVDQESLESTAASSPRHHLNDNTVEGFATRGSPLQRAVPPRGQPRHPTTRPTFDAFIEMIRRRSLHGGGEAEAVAGMRDYTTQADLPGGPLTTRWRRTFVRGPFEVEQEVDPSRPPADVAEGASVTVSPRSMPAGVLMRGSCSPPRVASSVPCRRGTRRLPSTLHHAGSRSQPPFPPGAHRLHVVVGVLHPQRPTTRVVASFPARRQRFRSRGVRTLSATLRSRLQADLRLPRTP